MRFPIAKTPVSGCFCANIYELINTEYLLGVTLEELAAPVDEAAAQVTEAVGDAAPVRSRFDCSIPDPVFESVCVLASAAVDTPVSQVADVAVRQMVTALDPNSAYHDPEEWKRIEDSGRYVGIGVRVAHCE